MQDKNEREHLAKGHLVRAGRENEPFIIKLWQDAFGDSEDYIRKFLEVHRNTGKDKNRVFLWKEQGECKTMLFALPAQLWQGGELKNARYLYAIATKKEERGKKYLMRMLPELKKELGEDNVFFLVPVPEVIPYYESLGFVLRKALPGFSLEIKKKRENQLFAASEKLVLEEITDVSYYYRLRQENLKNRDYVIWGVQEIFWALCDIFMAHGKAYVVKCEQGNFLLAGIRKEIAGKTCFQVIEETLPENLLEELGAELLEKLDCEKLFQDELSYMIEDGKEKGRLYLSLALNG